MFRCFQSLAAVFSIAFASLGQASAPNVLLIMADDLGVGDMGITGQTARKAAGVPYLETPNIDRIATEGVQYTQMYSTPMCKSTRSTLYTGFHQGHSFGDRNSGSQNRIRAGNEDFTYAQALAPSNYTTGMFGKWHQSDASGSNIGTSGSRPTDKGFDDVLLLAGQYHTPTMVDDDGAGNLFLTDVPEEAPGLPQMSQEVVTEHAINFIDNAVADDKPFAATVNYFLVHRELDVPQRPYPSFNDTSWPIAEQNYARGIHLLDQEVGKLLDHLDDPDGDGDTSDSLAEDTLVIFISDNGNQTKEGHSEVFFDSNSVYRGFKFRSLEGGVRTPFFARWTSTLAPGSVNDSHVGTYADFLPTFAEMAGQDVPIGLDGKSMWKTLSNTGNSDGTELQAWHSFNDGSWAIRLGDWKLYSKNGLFVYDLANDPSESNDLADSRPDILSALNQLRLDEGIGRDANLSSQTGDTYFAQYKNWEPVGGSNNLGDAANWSGGTANSYANGSAQPAANWDTGPADNWLATINNTTGTEQTLEMTASTKVLAMEVRGDSGDTTVRVQPGTQLSARNGVRISDGGRLHIERADLMTIREVEIRPGAALTGDGSIIGQQDLIDGITEFDGLLESQVINNGKVSPGQPDDLSALTPTEPPPPVVVFQANFDDRTAQVFGGDTAALNAARDHLHDETTFIGNWKYKGQAQGVAKLLDSNSGDDLGFIVEEQVTNSENIHRWDASFTQPLPVENNSEIQIDLLWGRTRGGDAEHRLIGFDNDSGGNSTSDQVFQLTWGDSTGVDPDQLVLNLGATVVDLGSFFVGGGVIDSSDFWDDGDLLQLQIKIDSDGMDITVSDDVHSSTVTDIPLTGSADPLHRLRWTNAGGDIHGYALDDIRVTTGTRDLPVLPPLDSLGTIAIDGDYSQSQQGVLELQLAGTDNSDSLDPQHDSLIASGNMTLGGELNVSLLPGYTPSLDDSFDILDFATIDGEFDTVSLPELPAGLAWDQSSLLVDGKLTVIAATADFNADGVVDGLDFLQWQRGFGVLYDQEDLSLWQSQFATALISNNAPAVPEPSSLSGVVGLIVFYLAGLGRTDSSEY